MDSVEAAVVDSCESSGNPTTLQERLAQATAMVAEGYPRSCHDQLERLVVLIKDADPRRLDTRTGWWSRFTGKDLAIRIDFLDARAALPGALAAATSAAADVTRTHAAVLEARTAAQEELASRVAFIEASRPDASYAAGASERDVELARLHAVSLEITVQQMDLVLADLVKAIARYHDVAGLLVPVLGHTSFAAVAARV
jgi:hypothetical protein